MYLKIFKLIVCFVNFNLVVCQEPHGANRTLANRLTEMVSVICVSILPEDEDDMLRVRAVVARSWANRCTTTYLTTGKDISNRRPVVQLHHFCKELEKYERKTYQWYLFIGGDGFVIAENLRYMLINHDPQQNVYFRSPDADIQSLHVILSYKAFKTFLTADQKFWNKCSASTIENCFEAKGITALNSRDEWFRDRLIPINPYVQSYKPGHRRFWFCDRSMSYPIVPKPKKRGTSDKEEYPCYSDFAVSFEKVRHDLMTVLDFLIYELRPYGINYQFDLPLKLRESNRKKEKNQKPVNLKLRNKDTKKLNMIQDNSPAKNDRKVKEDNSPVKDNRKVKEDNSPAKSNRTVKEEKRSLKTDKNSRKIVKNVTKKPVPKTTTTARTTTTGLDQEDIEEALTNEVNKLLSSNEDYYDEEEENDLVTV